MSEALGGKKPKVTDYYAAIAYGLCVGPVDYVSGVLIDEKYIFPGVETNGSIATTPETQPDGSVLNIASDWRSFPAMSSSNIVNAYLSELFGGDEAQGGIEGEIYVMFGDAAQVMPPPVQSWQVGVGGSGSGPPIGFTFGLWGINGPVSQWYPLPEQMVGSTCPGYRNVLTAWFMRGNEGFLWSTNNPMIRKSQFTVTRLPVGGGLGNTYREIAPVAVRRTRKHTIFAKGESPEQQEVTDMYVAGPDANPAHIIYEMLVNEDFGLGTDSSDIDTLSFQQAAAILHAERLGLSFCWKEQQQVQKFIEDVESHADGKLFTNPMTGLLTFRLVREPSQAMIDAAPRLDPSNSTILSFQRKGWSDLPNEVIVTWTNPYTEKKETTVVHNLANLAIQGRSVSDNRNFYGARNPDLAARLGTRELRSLSTPLVSAEIEVNASGWNIVPTDIVVLNWPEYGVSGVVFRVIRVNYGNSSSSKVRLSVIEDVFSLAVGDYYTPPASEHNDHRDLPRDIDFKFAMSAPAFFVQRLGALETLDTDDTYLAVISAQGSDNPRPSQLVIRKADILGAISWEGSGEIDTLPLAMTQTLLPMEATSFVSSFGPVMLGSAVPAVRMTTQPPYPGMFGVLGSDEATQEIVFIQKVEYNSTDQPVGYYLVRGALDTTPKAWPANTPIAFFEYDDDAFVRTPMAVGASVEMRLLSVTSLGTLAVNNATSFTGVVDHRPHRPIRPAGIRLVAGNVEAKLPDAWTGSGDKVTDPPAAPLDEAGRLLLDVPVGQWLPGGVAFVIHWSNRNRLLEDSRVLRWNEASIPAENGQSVQVTIADTATGDLLFQIEVLLGSAYIVPAVTLGASRDVLVRIAALDYDDLPSLQSVTARVKLGE